MWCEYRGARIVATSSMAHKTGDINALIQVGDIYRYEEDYEIDKKTGYLTAKPQYKRGVTAATKVEFLHEPLQ